MWHVKFAPYILQCNYFSEDQPSCANPAPLNGPHTSILSRFSPFRVVPPILKCKCPQGCFSSNLKIKEKVAKKNIQGNVFLLRGRLHAKIQEQESRDGAVVRGLASNCGLDLIPGIDAICGSSYCWFSSLLQT